MFRKVKNVNVKSPKNGSKFLDFGSGSLPQPLPKGKGFSNFDIRLYMRVYITPPWKCFGRRCVGFVFRLVYSFAYARCVGFETPQCMVQCIVCAGFETQTIHFVTSDKSAKCRVKCRVCV